MKKGRVLVIDDDPAMLDAFAETLTYYGYDVLLLSPPSRNARSRATI